MRPDIAAISFERVAAADPRATAYISAVASTLTNGGIVAARFRATTPIHTRMLMASGFPASDVEAFLGNPSVRRQTPELMIPERPAIGEVCGLRSFELEGAFVETLVNGGPYRNWEAREDAARAVARGFVECLADGRRGALVALRVAGVWSEWFNDTPWDGAHLICNIDSKDWWLVCTTDVD